jgi:hypothetical protein
MITIRDAWSLCRNIFPVGAGRRAEQRGRDAGDEIAKQSHAAAVRHASASSHRMQQGKLREPALVVRDG